MTEQAETREGQMVVVERDDSGKPTIWCDPEVAPLVAALNGAGFRTVASCSGHGKRPASIVLSDGREIIIAKDFDEARKIDGLFPGINGEPATIAAPAPAERVEQDHDAIALDKARNIMQIMYGEMPKGGSTQLLAMVQVCVLEAMSHVCTPQHAPAAVPLAAKHHGMCISAPGLLARVGGHLKGGAREMLKHLEEMATRYYAGDIAAVDEFLQLYCLDDKRPAEQQAAVESGGVK